jgi:hypothetical protein
MKDAQTYLEVCDLVANLIARKASDILARRPESLPRRPSGVDNLKRNFKMAFVLLIVSIGKRPTGA